MGFGGGGVICCFKMSDARTCLNTASLDPCQRKRLKVHRQEGTAGGMKVPEKADMGRWWRGRGRLAS